MKLSRLFRTLMGVTLPLIATNLLVLFNAPTPLTVAVAATYLLIMPGWLVLSLIVRERQPLLPGLSYSLGLSVLLLMVAGLVTSIVGPHIGISGPLTTVPLLVSLNGLILGLLAAVLATKRGLLNFIKPHYNRGDLALIGSSMLVPVLAAGGATTLNNGGSAWLALVTLAIAAAIGVATIATAKRRQADVPGLVMAFLALGLLFMTSLRGWFITGHDTQLEYYVFELTKQNQVWDISAYRDPYNACLSITILPTLFQQILHLGDVYVYKFLYQIIAATMVFNLYNLARRFTSVTIAALVAFSFITFPTFATDMAMLNRQEIAFVFFSLALVTLFDDSMKLAARRMLFMLFGMAMVLSHYSSSYVAAVMFVGAAALYAAWNWLKHRRGHAKLPKTVLTLPIAVVLVIFVALWNGPVTHTSKGITTTLGNIAGSIGQIFSSQTGEGLNKYSIAGKAAPTTQQLFDAYIKQSYEVDRPTTNPSAYYSDAVVNQYAVTPYDEPTQPLTAAGRYLEQRLNLPISHILNQLKQAYALLIQGLLGVGLALAGLAIAKWRRLSPKLAALTTISPAYYTLCGSAVILIVLQAILPQSAVDYGLLRLFQQNLFLLALPIVAGLIAITSFGKFVKWGTATASAIIVAFFLVLTGFVPQLVGGGRALLTLNNNGFYYDAYYTHATEIDAFHWFDANPVYLPVEADRYFSRIKLLANTGLAPVSRLLPATTPVDSFVYLSQSNITTDGQVIEYVNGDIVYYRFPIKFLEDSKNLIYASEGSRIYR